MEHNRVIYERPYDAEVEYLESGNTQFIDTGIIATNNTNFKMKVYTDSIQRQIFGQYELIQSQYLSFGTYFFNNTNKLVLYGVNNTYLPTRDSITDKLVEIELRDNKFILNSSVFDVTRNNVIGNKTLYLFKLNGLGITPNSHLKVYYCKIWNEDTLVRDFIPIRKGSTGYMYDKVSKKLFANKGTGNFILGQDVANPVPNIRRVFRFENKRFVMPMPYDRRVEYLETDGNQYIDTGIRTCDIGKISSIMRYDSKPSGTIGDGSVISKSFYGLVGLISKSSTYYYGAQFAGPEKEVVSSATYNDGKFHTLLLDILNRTFILDNNTPISLVITSTPPELNWYIFKRNAVTRTAVSKRKVIKIWNKSNILVRDFIPVRRGNVGYLYDKVSGKLFSNAGTGQFILGNDIN